MVHFPSAISAIASRRQRAGSFPFSHKFRPNHCRSNEAGRLSWLASRCPEDRWFIVALCNRNDGIEDPSFLLPLELPPVFRYLPDGAMALCCGYKRR